MNANERFNDGRCRLLIGDCRESLRSLEPNSVHCCVTSPPYWGLRDYGCDGQIGLEETPDKFVEEMVEVFREVRRVLRDDGTLWLNLGDSYASTHGSGKQGQTGARSDRRFTAEGIGSGRGGCSHGLKPKDLVGIPWRVAFALQAYGWWLRQDIIWHKPNPMPSSVTDRCTTAHEYLFLFAKSKSYYFDAEAISEPSVHAGKSVSLGEKSLSRGQASGMGVRPSGNALSDSIDVAATRNKRSVWTVSTKPYKGAHFATYPPDLVEPCIRAGTSEDGCCSSCGSPRVRLVEKDRVATRPGNETKVGRASDDDGSPYERHSGMIVGNRDPQRHVTRTVTVGWEASCDCDSETVPCVVLDPFGGSGTTAQVAIENNRRAILCELNPEYAELAVRRVTETHPALF